MQQYEQESGSTYREKFIIRYGLPKWENSSIKIQSSRFLSRGSSGGMDTVVLIPIVQVGDNEVESFLEAHLNGSVITDIHAETDYRNLEHSNIDTLVNDAEMLALHFMAMNFSTLEHQEFEINDFNLFHRLRLTSNQKVVRRRIFIIGSPDTRIATTICFQIYTQIEDRHCTSPGSCHPTKPCDDCNLCVTYTNITESVCQTMDEPWWTGGGGGGGGSGGGTTGGGGGNGGTTPVDPNPCNAGGRLNVNFPCGGDPGDTGWEPIPVPDGPLSDPCATAAEAAAKMDAIWQQARIDTMLSLIPNLATLTAEKGFATIKKISINPSNRTDTSIAGYRNTQVFTGTDSGIKMSYNMSSLEFTATWVHTHPALGYNAHSANDVYQAISNSIQEGHHFVGSIVVAHNGATYALTITNRAAALAFFGTMSQNLDGAKWNENSAIGGAFREATKYFEEKNASNPNQRNIAYELAMASVLNEFNVGITLNKRNAAGQFKPIVVRREPDPRKPKRAIYTQDCQ